MGADRGRNQCIALASVHWKPAKSERRPWCASLSHDAKYNRLRIGHSGGSGQVTDPQEIEILRRLRYPIVFRASPPRPPSRPLTNWELKPARRQRSVPREAEVRDKSEGQSWSGAEGKTRRPRRHDTGLRFPVLMGGRVCLARYNSCEFACAWGVLGNDYFLFIYFFAIICSYYVC